MDSVGSFVNDVGLAKRRGAKLDEAEALWVAWH